MSKGSFWNHRIPDVFDSKVFVVRPRLRSWVRGVERSYTRHPYKSPDALSGAVPEELNEYVTLDQLPADAQAGASAPATRVRQNTVPSCGIGVPPQASGKDLPD